MDFQDKTGMHFEQLPTDWDIAMRSEMRECEMQTHIRGSRLAHDDVAPEAADLASTQSHQSPQEPCK